MMVGKLPWALANSAEIYLGKDTVVMVAKGVIVHLLIINLN